MTRLLLVIVSFATFTLSLTANASSKADIDCKKWALSESLNYCQTIYHYRSQSYASCKLAAGRSYENDLVGETIDFSSICEPFFLMPCKSGMTVYLGHRKECEK